MFSFIFLFLFLAVLFVFMIGSTIIRGILNLLFGRRTSYQQTTGETHGHSHAHSRRDGTTGQSQQASPKKREKIFDDSEGEYVDFEEIQD